MKALTCIIIDDELHSRETTKMFLEAVSPEVEIIASIDNALEGAKTILEYNPDFVLLDIQMPDINGIKMLGLIPDFSGEIIFLTAHNQYAVTAFKKGALHYLLKPLDPDDLRDAVKRVKDTLDKDKVDQQGNWIYISTSEGWIVLRKSDIIRCESDKNYTTIYTTDQKHLISKSLKEVEQKLSSDDFYRVHHSHLVHISKIAKILKSDGGNILMTNNNLIPISKNRKKDFFEWFQGKVNQI